MNEAVYINTAQSRREKNLPTTALPPLSAEEAIFYYSQKAADAEMARIEMAACHRILAEASEQFDAAKARKFRNAVARKARVLGLVGADEL